MNISRRTVILLSVLILLAAAGGGGPRPRTFPVRCRDGKEKAIRFSPVELSDGTEYVTYEDVTEERRAYGMLVGEIAELRKK